MSRLSAILASILVCATLTVSARSADEVVPTRPADSTAAVPADTTTATAPVTFTNDVMAVLSKAGCNMGACHGNKNGKGGLKLSLRGESPAGDFDALTRDVYARRIDPLSPDQSLILLKATGAIAHEGGQRFTTDSPEYRVLRQWIDQGAGRDDASKLPRLVKLEVTPTERVLVDPDYAAQIQATAHFSDGTTRDVTRTACYEQSAHVADIAPDGKVTRKKLGETAVIVRYLHLQQVVSLAFVPARPTFAWRDVPANNFVDEHVFAKLRTMRVNPSELAGDDVFVRRAYLDLLGLLPTADEARAFVNDSSADKRSKLVDALLRRPEYADFWTLKWADVLRLEERTLDRTGVQAFHGWIRQAVADNVPLDQFVRELVTGTGSTYKNPPANFYRALRDPVARGEAVGQVFLGVRLNCAQCHNHPFDRWTQDDYYGWANVFSRVDYEIVENKRRDKNDQHEFVGEQVVVVKKSGGMNDPRTNAPVKEARLLGDDAPLPAAQDRLDSLGSWLTGKENRLFAKSQVNRIWAQFMGRGLVDPVDDFRATNPASHPALLEQLTDHFIAGGYDVQKLIKLITASRAYQLGVEPNDTNADDETNYSRSVPRRLTAEQMTDAVHQVAGVASEFAGYEKGTRASQIQGVQAVPRREAKPTLADQFLVGFGKPPRQLSCDCERSNETALNHTFQLVSGPLVADLIARQGNRIDQLIEAKKTDEQIVDELYWTALSRPPASDERAGMVEHVKAGKDRRKALEDVAWALLNAKEFVLRR